MHNPLLDLIHNHASVRSYKPDALPTKSIEIIVSAAQRASTSSNLQLYSVVAVTDAVKRDRLAVLSADQDFIRQAPVFLVWCADLARLDRACQLRGIPHVTKYTDIFLTAAVDASLASQNAALAAEALGLGICYVGSLRNHPRAVIELLQLPRLVFPLFGMTLGVPAKPAKVKQRLPLAAVLHWDIYTSDQDALLEEYDRVMAASKIYDGRQTPYPDREIGTDTYGWLEHSARRASKASRTDLRYELAKSGFLLE